MFISLRLLTTTTIISTLAACGSSDSSPNNQNVIDSPLSHGKATLIKAYDEKVDSLYTGSKQPADLSITNANEVYHALWGADYAPIPYVPFDGILTEQSVQSKLAKPLGSSSAITNSQIPTWQTLVSANQSGTYNCDSSGTISFTANLNNEGVGTIEYEMTECQGYYSEAILTGKGAIVTSKGSTEELDVVLFFDNVNTTELDYYNGQVLNTFTTSGYLQINNVNTYPPVKYQQNLVTKVNGREVVTPMQDYFYNPSGDIYISDIGHIKVESEFDGNSPFYPSGGTISFSGKQNAQFEFSYNKAKYLVDTNNDGELDSGAYLNAFDYFGTKQDTSQLTLVSIEELSLPPTVSRPGRLSWDDYYTTTPITVSPGSAYDEDTATEDLIIGFNWYINGVLVEDVTTSTLPAYKAIYGDEVKVSMVVSDGANVVESDYLNFTIADSPSTFTVSNLPDDIKVGDTIQFNVNIVDPDYPNADNSAINFSMSGAPTGAVMDDSGLVEWTVDSEFIFPQQTFNFSFDMSGDSTSLSTNVLRLPINVGGKHPIARSGIEVPYNNDSMWVGDFTGDGQNEVLSTDNRNRVFIISEDNGDYKQSWMYPLNLPTEGAIKQVIGKNVDEDAQLEILVATEHGISQIDNQTSMAKVLFETTEYITKFDIVDLQGNGQLSLVMLTSNSDYSSSNKSLIAYPFNDLSDELFSTNVASASDFTVANVDSDSQLEIVLNNGRVYDGQTYANQWLSGTEFGSQAVKVADLNNNGIGEIIGVDTWGSVIVFSAVDKTQLYSFDNFNTCTLETKNIDQDPEIEVLIGDCQWGNITAYDWNQAERVLEQKWALDMQGHGSKSIAVGDSDNDGLLEVHWGTGQSSSGADGFIVADITTESASVKDTNSTPQLDSYTTAGWINIEPEQERAVFFVPSSSSGYGGSVVVQMDANGNSEISNVISSNWDNSRFATVTDYNHDGYGDMFAPSTETYDGAFSVIQLSDMSRTWSVEGDYDNNIGVIKAYDVNKDNFEDAIYADSRVLNILDVENQLILANFTFNNSISNLDVGTLNGNAIFAVSSYNKVHLLQYEQNKLTELGFIDKECSNLMLFNQDDDLIPEILCVTSSGYYSKSNIAIFKYTDSGLAEVAEHQLDEYIRDIAVDKSTDTKQNFFAVSDGENGNSFYDRSSSYITKYSPTAQAIWTGPELIGSTTSGSLKHRYSAEKGHQFMLATNSAMYLINP